LISRIEQGKVLLVEPMPNVGAYEDARKRYRLWSDFNAELLKRSFTTDEYGVAYERAGHIPLMVIGARGLGEKVSDLQFDITAKVTFLESLAGRIDLIEEDTAVTQAASAAPALPAKAPSDLSKVFVVHGRDEEAKSVVARFIEHCGLEPIILHERTDRGRTIIEKFEEEAEVGFAVVLLTPDDVGGLSAGGTLEVQAPAYRARQNVVLELGYFLGKLTRSRVCALMKGSIEVPSDYSGVVYTPMGADEGWKVKLARELKAAGYDIDMNKALA